MNKRRTPRDSMKVFMLDDSEQSIDFSLSLYSGSG